MVAGDSGAVLLAQTTIAGAVTNVVGNTIPIPRSVEQLLVECIFLYGSGGTTAKLWVQTRVKGGTWRDVMCFAHTTAALTRWSAVRNGIALAAVIAASDAALVDNTILDGFIGDELRVKYTTTGTYAGATSLACFVSVKG